MTLALRFAVAVILGLALLSVPAVPAGARCADVYVAITLGPFPVDASVGTFLFHGSEGDGGSFNVRWKGLACGQPFTVNAAYSDAPGSAMEGSDYQLPDGRTPDVCEVGCPEGMEASIPFTIHGGDGAEAVTEMFTVVLSDPLPEGTLLDPPSSAPFVIVDAEGSSRVAFDQLPYAQSETESMVAVPVWRAGPPGGTVPVTYSVGPGPENPAATNEDYTVTSPNPLVFGPNDRVELITLSIVNDNLSEPPETVQIDLQGAVSPSTKLVSILDNEENQRPHSRLHHPRHRWRYKKRDFRIREVHIFAHDNSGGSGVVGAQLALRRNLTSGDCVWLTDSGWEKADCSNRQWIDGEYDSVGDLWRIRLKQLKASVRSGIKDYTAFSRAIDGAGNVEKDFAEKRNLNTFEVKRSKPKR